MTEAYSPANGLTRRNFLKSTGVAAAAVAAGGAGAFAAGGLAQAEAHAALAVANDDQCGELCDAAALNGLGNAVEGNDFFAEFLGLIAAVAAVVPSVIVICHFVSSSR